MGELEAAIETTWSPISLSGPAIPNKCFGCGAIRLDQLNWGEIGLSERVRKRTNAF